MSRARKRGRPERSYSFKWSIPKAKSLWLKGVRIKDIAAELKVNEMTIKMAAQRYGWPPRKTWKQNPLRSQKLDWVPVKVTKRCQDCGGRYECQDGDYSGHPGCPAIARNGTQEARTPAEGSQVGVAA